MTKYSEDFQPMDRPPRPGVPMYPGRPQPPPPRPCPCPPPPPPPPHFGPGCDNPVFAGKKPLAYLDDLAALHGEVLRWLIGPNGEFTNNGYAPLNQDGKIDEKYFSQLGVDTYVKNQLVKDNATKYNFYGNLVHVEKELINSLEDCEDGGNAYSPKEIVNIYIGENKNASNLGTNNGITDGSIELDFDTIDMIVPDASLADYRKKVYGDWVPGTVVQGFNAKNKNSCAPFDAIIAESKESICFSNLTTKFILTVYGPDGGALAISETAEITSSNNNVPLIGANQNMRFEVSDFREQGFSYSGKIRWIINIAGILGSFGGRFGLQITQVEDDKNTITWRSEDYLYNTGDAPVIGGLYEKIVETIANDPSYKPVYMYSSGLKFLTRGKVYVGAYDIDNLNTNAAVADKAAVSSDFLDISNYTYNDSDIGDYSLNVDLANARFTHAFDIKEDILIFGPSYYEITLKNASGNTTLRKESHILINTLRNLEVPTKLVETFSDESHRCSVDFVTDETGVQFEKWYSEQSLVTVDGGRGLLVIPGFGLVYPTVVFDYSAYIPTPNPDYSKLSGTRYFCRRFYSEEATRKFGGTFVFEGITSEEFMQNGLSCEISKDNGANWLTLKSYREGDISNGILTNIEDTSTGCNVQFAFENDESVCGNVGLLFKIAFEPSVKSVIKRITLNNISNTDEW